MSVSDTVTTLLGMEVGLDPGHIVLDGDPAHPQKGHSLPIFGPCPLWPNSWMYQKPLGMEVGLDPGDIVLDPNSSHRKGHSSPLLFGPCLLWSNDHLSEQLLSSCYWLHCRNLRALSVLLLDILFVRQKLLNRAPILSCIMSWSSGRVCHKHR